MYMKKILLSFQRKREEKIAVDKGREKKQEIRNERCAFNLSPVSALNLNCVHACKYKKGFKTREILNGTVILLLLFEYPKMLSSPLCSRGER